MYIKKGPYLQDPKKDSVIIMWETDEEASGEVRLYDSLYACVPVNYIDKGGETVTASDEFSVFSGEKGTMHAVTVSGLKTGQDYYYQVVSETSDSTVISEKYPFRTAPCEDTAVSFVLTAENGGCGGQLKPYMPQIIERIRREHPDFIMSLGDITDNGLLESSWEACLFSPFKELIANTPFYPCVGNHEVDTGAVKPEELEERYRNFNKYFAFPRYYSFDYGCAHFCVLDCPSMMKAIHRTEKDRYIPELIDDFENSEQYRFPENDLRSSSAIWKMVIFHYPPYTSAIFGHDELKVLCPLFEKYGVDIVFNSRAIVYERSHPIKNGKIAKNGVRYILVGGYDDVSRWFRNKQNGFAAKTAGRPGYVHVSLTPYALELQAIDYEGKLFDALTLEKEEHK